MKRVKNVPIDAQIEGCLADGWAEGGLLIHKMGSWCITHQLSGKCVDAGIDTRAQAVSIVETLLGTGIDFTRDASYLELHREEIVAVLCMMHSTLRLTQMDYNLKQENSNG